MLDNLLVFGTESFGKYHHGSGMAAARNAPAVPTQSIADKLLPPRRRKQIEVWLDETVQFRSLQSCASDRRFGHAWDAAGYSSSSSSSSSSSLQQQPPRHPSSNFTTTTTTTTCPVCGRHFVGDRLPPPPTSLSSSSPPSPTALHQQPPQSVTTESPPKPRSVLQGLRSAMSTLKLRDPEDRYDPALATKMFRTSSSATDKGGGGGGGASSISSSLGSSEDGGRGEGGDRSLNDRMARLRRAQKLLQKSHPNNNRED